MGKKHIIQADQEELLKEKEKVDDTIKKEAKAKPTTERVSEGKIYVSSSYKNTLIRKIYVSSSYNNTLITLTNSRGQVLAWKSAGSVGFKGTKKATSFAASRVAEAISNIYKKIGIEKISVLIRGVGAGRESAVRTLVAQGLNVISIKDVTPIPHNGCRPKKVRRV